MNKQTTEQLNTGKHFAEYKVVANYITKDGHAMFPEDVVQDLNRKSHLEREILELRERVEKLQQERENLIKGDWTPEQYHSIITSKPIKQFALQQQAKGAEDFFNYCEDIKDMFIPHAYYASFTAMLHKQSDELEQGE
jgi:hypothetical protein